jgi:hypothetical protein
MVRPRRRGSRRLHPPGLSANPRLRRTRACGYSGSNPASALRSSPRPLPRHCVARRSSICFLCSSFHCASPFYLLRVSHCVARPSSIRLRLVSLGCLSCASFIYLSPCSSFCCVSPFYLLLVSHCITRRSSICLSCALSVFGSTAGAEGRKGDQTRWRAGRVKGWT